MLTIEYNTLFNLKPPFSFHFYESAVSKADATPKTTLR